MADRDERHALHPMSRPATTAGRATPPGGRLGDATRVGAVDLTVTSIDRSIAYYRDVIGLEVHRRDASVAAMGAGGEELVVLREQPDARRAGRHAGLYHFALLFPTRKDLARVALRIAGARAPIQGASNHGTHEAIYLPDPDGNGIELAWDFPRERWPDISGPQGYGGGPAPLDIDDLLATVGDEAPPARAPRGLRMGHVHLHVGDLTTASAFYRDGLGFDVMTDLGSAVFVSAGGYHHHVGYNVWRGNGVPPAPEGVVGLRHWTLIVAGDDELAAVRMRLAAAGAPIEDHDGGLLSRDPSGIAVHVIADPSTPRGEPQP
jgi:catechol 2,3-dioxygenase